MDGDIHKAYDHVSHQLLARVLLWRGVPLPIAAAWIRELRRAKSIFLLDDNTWSDPVGRTQS
eukprot:2359818-Lingulodinium_polyedra.AAC.1